MKRIKLVLPAKTQSPALLGIDAKLFDADTGEELDWLVDLRLNLPLDGPATVQATFHVSEIELR